MSFSLTTVESQVIALLNLSYRDSSGTISYGTALGDLSYSSEEIARACQSAVTMIMQAICETDGHFHRTLFQTSTALTHGAVLPSHRGSIGVPRILPYSGCAYSLLGKWKSIEEIAAYRANPDHLYSQTAHNATDGIHPSKLAGFYSIDSTANVVYFTGYSAVSDLADFDEDDYTILPDSYYSVAISLAIAGLLKDGSSDEGNFAYYQGQGMQGLATIRASGANQPVQK